MDTQTIEIIGRNRLINELLAADLEVAAPLRDRGIDLIGYRDRGDMLERFTAFPIQMKASSTRGFSIDRKYSQFPTLIIAYVWDLFSTVNGVTYALTQQEATSIAEQMAYTRSESWSVHGKYTVTRPTQKLVELLQPYRMNADAWRNKIDTLSQLKASDANLQ